MAAAKGYGRILAYPYYDKGIGTINGAMLVKRDTIKNNPKLVSQLVEAHAKATEYLKAHPKQWLEKAATFGIPLAILEKAAPNIELAWKMDKDFIKKVANLGARMKAMGIIKKEPDYNKLINLRFVEAVKLNN